MGDFARASGASGGKLDRGLVFDTAQLAVQYALSGEGIALGRPVLFRDEIAAGRLVQPFDLQVDDGYGYYLSIHPDDLDRPEISLFRTWLIRRFTRPPALSESLVSACRRPAEDISCGLPPSRS